MSEYEKGSARRYAWPRPAVTVDAAVFTVAGTLNALRLQVLLVERGDAPYKGHWALPGGFVHENEDLAAAAARELLEETGIAGVRLDQVAAVGRPGRDPRGHTVTVLHVALVAADRHALVAAGDAAAARYFDVAKLPALAFDHGRLLEQALAHLRAHLGDQPLAFELLPKAFALSELQALCEAILGRSLDRRNFRRKVLEAGFVAEVAGRREGAHRPARLYRFVPRAFARFAAERRELPF